MTTAIILLVISCVLVFLSGILLLATLGLRHTVRKELSDWAREFNTALQNLGVSDQAVSEMENKIQLNSQEVQTLKEHHNLTIKEVQRGFENLYDEVLKLIGPEKADQLNYKQ